MTRWAGALVGLTVAGVAAQTVLLVEAGVPLLSRAALERTFPIIPAAAVVGAVVGALIVARHPRHRVGWLLCLGQAGAALGLPAQTLAAGVERQVLAVAAPVARAAAWVGALFGANYALTLLAALLLLVPDGRLRTRPRRAVLGLVAASYGLRVVALALAPPSGPAAAPPPVAHAVGLVGDIGTTLGLVAAAGALGVRLRSARDEERQQLRWVAVAAAALAVALAVMVGVGVARGTTAPWYLQAAFYLGYLAVPVATGFAVLRYRLYDVDVIIGSAVRLAALTAFVVAGYVGVVVVLGRLLGGGGAVWSSLGAYALVALAFQPLRRRVDDLADRVVHGPRAAPYDSLAAFTRGLDASRSDPQVLEVVARACAEVVGARRAAATVAVPGAPDLTAWWPPGAEDAVGRHRTPAAPDRSPSAAVLPRPVPPQPVSPQPVPPQPVPPGDEPQVVLPVDHRGELLGRIELALPPGRSPTRTERRLLAELAGQAGLAFRNVALRAALEARAAALVRDGAALEASRRRLLGAADAERARVAAAIRHDVLDRLAPLPAALDGLDRSIVSDPAAAQAWLRALEQATADAVAALRVITGGVLPPVLVRRGLAPALEAFARQSPDRPVLRVAAGADGRRYPASVEVAAYTCCVEAARAVRAGAELHVDAGDERLVVTVRGSPVDATGWQHLADRVEALGGRLSAEPGWPEGPDVPGAPGDGRIVLRVELPVQGTPSDDHPGRRPVDARP